MPPAVGCIAAAPNLASLDQGLLAIQYRMSMHLPCPLQIFFSYRNIVGTGGFSGRAIMRPWDVVLLDMPSSHSHSLSALGDFLGGPSCSLRMLFYWNIPSSHSHSLLALGIFWEGHHVASGCCSIDMPLVTPTPTLLQLGFLLPSSPTIHLPIPHHQVWKCFAHIKHLRHQHITSAWFASSPLHLPFTYPFHTTRSGSASLTSST